MDKKCSKCKEIKDISCFYKDKSRTDGHDSSCKSCKKSYKKKWVQANQDKVRQSHKKYYAKNKEQVINRANQCKRKIRKTPKGKLDGSMRSSIYQALISQKAGRKWEDLVGYNIDDLIAHLEKRFDEFMDWNNYGAYWHILLVPCFCCFVCYSMIL